MVDDIYDHPYLVVGHRLMTGQAQLLTVYALSDRQRALCPLAIALLPMGRYGIVNDGLDALFCHIALQRVAILGQNWEDVEHAVCSYRHLDDRRRYVGMVYGCYLPTSLIIGVEIFQLNTQDSSLQFVNARVAPDIVEDIFSR